MTRQIIVVSIIAMSLLTGAACHAGWLHRAYQGEFCAHTHKYVVNNDGTIAVQTLGYGGGGVTYTAPCLSNSPCQTPSSPTWQTDISFQNINDLDAVIGDLQKLSKEVHAAYGEH